MCSRSAGVASDPDADWLDRLVRDAEFFSTRISKIEGASNIGEAVLKLASDKSVQSAEPAATPPQSSTDSTTSESKDSGSS